MKVLIVCFVFVLLAGSSISDPIEAAEQSEIIDVAEAGLSETEDKIRAKKSTLVNFLSVFFSQVLEII